MLLCRPPPYPPSRQPQTRQRAVCGTKRTISLSPVQLGQRHINRPLVHRFTLVHRLNVGCPHGAGAFQSLCQAPQAPKTALKRELGKLGKLGRGTRKKSAARELGKLVPPPLGGRVPGRVRACEKNKQRQDEFGETVGPQPPTSLMRLTLPGAAWSAPHLSSAGSPLEFRLPSWSRCLSRFVPSAASPQNGAETRTRITRINSSRYEKERCCRELVYLVSTL